MFSAKNQFQNKFAFFSTHMNEKAQKRLELESELREAVLKNQFEIHVQPQIDIRTMSLFGIEVLIRWAHPSKGMIFPNDFISVRKKQV